ncbi:hypothetical protein GCM10018785_25230 [Streptomyces longispororuber]|uniref:Uncharacterized protein n=1 Tax=Streptomyces longispororuber TaxID=68230 RepID=A0A918ZKM2_9ACTN|nr:hypothetical protein [Streptomyces longispororuber]GHE54766.1 hypothetical protein GCM10018785_25230 [Streptomyces longispororuber]
MLVSMSAVFLLGLLIWFLLHIHYLRWGSVLLCGAFGFLLSQTAAAPTVQAFLDGVTGFLGQLRL